MFYRGWVLKELHSYETKILGRKYIEDVLNKQMEKVDLIEWKVLLQNNEKSNSKKIIQLELTRSESYQKS